METIGKSNRKYCALLFEFFFSIGQLVLVTAAYFLRTWRYLTFIVILPCLPFFLLILFSNESINFLLKKKKYDQVQKILEKIANTNKTTLDEVTWRTFLSKESEKNDRRNSSTASVILKPHYIFIVLIGLNWIVNNFVFHGFGLRANDLGMNPYVTFAFSAIFEILCSIFTFKLLQFKQRRKPYFFLMLVAGLSCTIIYILSI
jgi:hypothetical protein